MKEFPQLNLTVQQLQEMKMLYEHSNWECLCTTIDHCSEPSRELRECLCEIRRVLGAPHVRLDEYMLGKRLTGDDARQLRLDWLDHEIQRQQKIPKLPEGFEYLGRGPVELPIECEVAILFDNVDKRPGHTVGRWFTYSAKAVSGMQPDVHYAVKRKPEKLGPWHVKNTFEVGDRFEQCGDQYMVVYVGSDDTRIYQLVNSRTGVFWSPRAVPGNHLKDLTPEQIKHLMGDCYEFTYVEK